MERPQTLEHIPIVGIQAAPPRWNRLQKIGLGRLSRFNHGSFTQMALNEMYKDQFPDGYPVENVQCFDTHAKVIHALGKGAIEMAIIPVDNTFSGRVKTSINALRDARYRILEEKTTEIGQYLLHHNNHNKDDIEYVMSQKPALDQARSEIERNNWGIFEAKDTVMSAIKVARKKGIIGGKRTAAIASRLAGEKNGLTVGPLLSKKGNATTFWRIDTGQSKEVVKNPNRMAFTFTVADRPGSLYDMVAPITDLGCDFTDIDCHLSKDEDAASFFAEIEIPEGVDPDELLRKIYDATMLISEPGKTFSLMGVYRDTTKPGISDVVQFDSEHIPTAIDTNEWARVGSSHAEGSQVVYISAKNKHASLKGMLGAFKFNSINVKDMSRPTSPNGNGARGFFFVIEPNVDISAALADLEESEYKVQQYHYTQGELALAA